MFKKMTLCLACVVISLLAATGGADPILIWTCDEGTGDTTADKSGNGYDGTLMDGAGWQAGGFNGKKYALSLTGGSFVENTDGGSFLNGQTALTMAAWIKSNEINSDRGIFNGEVPDGGDNVCTMRYDASGASFGGTNLLKMAVTAGGVEAQLESSSGVQTTEWQHVAMTWASGEQIMFYIDGELDTPAGQSAANTGEVSGCDTFIVGRGAKDQSNGWNGLIDEVRLYDTALTQEEIQLVMLGGGGPELASAPIPEADAVDVYRDTLLSWSPGELADTHNIYLGTDFDDVNDASMTAPQGVLIAERHPDTTLDPGRLEFDTTYHWRVDEVNSPSSPGIFMGPVWSFTTEPEAYPVENIQVTASSFHGEGIEPEKTIDGSGLDAMDLHSTSSTDMWLTAATDTERWIQYEFDKTYKLHEMWVWNQNQSIESLIGFGAKDVTVEISVDGENWTTLSDVPEFAKAPGMPGYAHDTTVDFGGQMAKSVKLTINSPWGMLAQSGLSEVRFLFLPVTARYPEPIVDSTTDSIDITLQWRPGREADQHEVLLSSDLAAVEDGNAAIGQTPNSSFSPGPLNYSTTYYWQIIDTNALSTPPRYEGDIWSFTAVDYLVLDDFEMYTDEEFKEIWAFWADGYQDDNNGSVVGNGNAGETNVVYQGGQSMPLHYDNSGAAISEATYTFDSAMDWTRGEPDNLSLFLSGNAPEFLQEGDTLTVGASGADIWNVADDFRFVYKRLSGDGSITAKVESLGTADPWTKGGVMIRESTSPESSFAMMVATGTNGVAFQHRLVSFTDATSDSSVRPPEQADQDDEPVWVRVERVGDELNAYWSLDGVTWSPSANNPQSIFMLPDVLIGLCLTSHNVNVTTTAVYSNVTTTGGVSGSWTAEAIGGTHPSNDPAPMYLVVTDASNNEKLVTHPNPNASVISAWEEWAIPLSDLSPVNLSRVKSVTIGVGERGGSASGAEGTAFIDLLRIGTPMPVVEEPNEPVAP